MSNGYPQQQLPFGAPQQWQQPPQQQPQQQPQFGAPQGVPQGWQPPQPGQPGQQPAPQAWNPQNVPAPAPQQQWQPPQGAPQQWNPQHQQAPQGAPQQWNAQGQQPQPGYQMPQGQMPMSYGADPFAQNPFGGLDDATPNAQYGEYFQDGNYHVRILKTHLMQIRKNQKLMYCIETEILASNNPDLPAGKRATSMIDLTNRDMRDRNLLTFLAACMGFNPSDFQKGQQPPRGGTWSQLANETTQAGQPLRGLEIGLIANTREKKNSPGEFTDMGWMPKHLVEIGPMLAAKEPTPQQMNYGAPGAPPPAVFGGAAGFGGAPAGFGGAPAGFGGPPAGFGGPPGGTGFGAPPPQGFAPQGMPQGAPGFGMQAPQGMPQGAPQGMPQGAPQGFGAPAPAPAGYGAPAGAPQGAPQGMPQGMPQAPQGWR